MPFQPGYQKLVCAKADIKVPGHNGVLTRRQQADLAGRRQGVPGVDAAASWQSHDMQTATQAGASY